VRVEDVRAFTRRDWHALAAAKDAAWLEHRRAEGIPGTIRVAEQMRRYVRALRPEWPTDDERGEDLATHVRVSEALRRVGRHWSP
jgi:hypothetical protein